MRIPRLLAAAVLLLVIAGAAAQEEAVAAGHMGVHAEGDAAKARAEKEALILAAELALLRANLELSIVLRTPELKSKDGGIEQQGARMTQDITTLQSEIASLQSKEYVAAGEQTDKANAWAIELEKIEKFKKDMEARASDAEKMVQEQNAMLERLRKIGAAQEQTLQALKVAEEELMRVQSVITTIYEQLRELQKIGAEQEQTLHDLKVAEEELMWVQSVITTVYEQLGEVRGAWSPPWLATHAARSMELMSSQWNEHGKPALNNLLHKASEKSVQATEWARPHVENAKEKWIPVIKENWATAKTNTQPYVQMVSAKSVEVYEASRDTISPHVLKAHELTDPCFQEAKKLSKPYIDQFAKASKPHVEKIETTLKPYTQKAGQAYEKFRVWCSNLD